MLYGVYWPRGDSNESGIFSNVKELIIVESHLGRYEVLEELGRGEVGVVYKAYDPLIDRFVAIKTIDLLQLVEGDIDEYKARFYQEAKSAGRLNHPNIITIYDLGRKGDIAYIAMELMEGRELQDIVSENDELSLIEKLDVAFQVAAGLAYAHEHGVVHRDIKPSNIMVLRGKHVKIADFGIARVDSSLWKTKAGKIIGSPLYMSPEQIQSHQIDARSDIFSFGIVFYQMITGKLPFNGGDVNSVMYQIVNEQPMKPRTLAPELPEYIESVIERCLSKMPDDRYQTAGELMSDLHSCRKLLSNTKTGDVPATHYFDDEVLPGREKGAENNQVRTVLLTAIISLAAYYLLDHFIFDRFVK